MPPPNQVCLHLEPYEGRSAASVRSELEYITRSYGKHPAFYRMSPPDGGPRRTFETYMAACDVRP